LGYRTDVRVVRVFGLVTQIACCATVVAGGPAEGNAADAPGDPIRSGSDAGAGSPAPLEATGAHATPPGAPAGGDRTAIFIGGTSACPLPSDVWNELGTLVPANRLMDYQARLNAAPPASTPAAGPAPPLVEIVDLGEKYRVIAGGRVREYRNQGRDCTYRARVAAVFVALTVDPAVLAVEPPPPASAPSPPLPPPPPPSQAQAQAPTPSSVATAEQVADVEALVAVDRSAGGGPQATHTGAGVRLILGRGPLAIVVGALAFRTADSSLGGVSLTQGHDPLDLGVRLRAQHFFFEPYAEIGLALALLSEEGRQTSVPMKSRAIELGGFLVAGVRVPAQSRVGLVLAARGEWVPSPADLAVLPTGGLGHAPALWFGATAGATVGF
jgi:hypothetical protein